MFLDELCMGMAKTSFGVLAGPHGAAGAAAGS